jgi:hypothetical protein
MNPIAYFFVRLGLFVLFVIPVCLCWRHGYEESWHLAGLTWAICIFGLVYVIAAGWFANRTAHHYIFEVHSLYSSMKFAFYDARLRLAFLPGIGHWFMPADDKDDDASSER